MQTKRYNPIPRPSQRSAASTPSDASGRRPSYFLAPQQHNSAQPARPGDTESAQVTLSGDLSGPYTVEDRHPDGRLVLRPDLSVTAMLARHGERRLTGEELERQLSGPRTDGGAPAAAGASSVAAAVPVEFHEEAIVADLARQPPAAGEALARFRRGVDRDGGLSPALLERCHGQGGDGGALVGCMQVRVAWPTGSFVLVLLAVAQRARPLALRAFAYGARDSAEGRPGVYPIAAARNAADFDAGA
jgi:hypothetical protein